MKIKTTCPKCEGTDIEYQTSYGMWFDDENMTVSLEVDCENCGAELEMIFEFKKIKLSE